MKKLTIRTKMALWYSVTIVVLLFVFFGIALAALAPAMAQGTARMLQRDAAEIADEIDWEDGHLEVDDDIFEKIGNSTIYAVYGLDEVPLFHSGNANWLDTLTNLSDTPSRENRTGETWLALQYTLREHGNTTGLLRVAVPVTGAGQATGQLLVIFLFILPLSAGLAVLVGLFIAKRALRPVDDITTAARQISRGDLSTRLNFTHTNDEVGRLAATFDEMLDTLEDAFRREKQFTSDASHELRTPLSVIMAHAEEALENQQATADELRESMAVVHRKSLQMQKMLAQMLTLARMFEGRQTLEVAPVELGSLITDIVDESRLKAAEKQIEISVNSQPVKVQGDLLLLTRLVMNLVDNGIKYGKLGGHLHLQLSQLQNGGAILTVADDGLGISQEDLPHIFERFYRASRSRTDGGTGLGLPIAAQIARLHGCVIRAESVLGQGTTFIVEWPGTVLG